MVSALIVMDFNISRIFIIGVDVVHSGHHEEKEALPVKLTFERRTTK